MKLNELTIQEAHASMAVGEISAQELVAECLAAIDDRDGDIHAFLDVYHDDSLAAARESDKRRAAGETPRPLEGIPIALKDNLCLKGKRTTAGSKILEHYVASYDATVSTKLKEAGAVILGKTNLDEFAMGSSTENSAFGVTKNPHDVTRVPGGSSGGSAAAVAAGMCLGALGSDTGGSVRQPASFCGVVGFKPSYGRVSRYGLISMGSSLDQIGPLARSVGDARYLYETIRGNDHLDTTTVVFKDRAVSQNLRVGIPKEYGGEGVASEVETAVRGAVALLGDNGMAAQEVSLPHTEYALATYYIIMPSEVSANLARFDNVRYRGFGGDVRADSLIDVYKAVRGRGFGDEVRRRIMVGTYTLSAGYFDAYYGRAQRVRSLLRRDLDRAFEEVDVIVAPTSPTTAFDIGARTSDPLQMYRSDIFTVTANLAGVPAISVPIPVRGLPIGLQFIGPHGADDLVLQVARQYESLVH